MTRRIRFEEHVEHDLLEARVWYDGQQPNRGDQFLSAVFTTFDRITEMPMAYPVVHDETRRALVRGYPYSVYFRLDGNDIAVLAVVHNRRHSNHWRSRI